MEGDEKLEKRLSEPRYVGRRALTVEHGGYMHMGYSGRVLARRGISSRAAIIRNSVSPMYMQSVTVAMDDEYGVVVEPYSGV